MPSDAMTELLNGVPYPTFPPNVDFRDASDAIVGAILEASRRDPERFFDVLEREPSLLASTDVLWAIGGIKHERAIPILLHVLRDPDSMRRWSAANGLSSRKDPRIVDAFIDAVRDRAPTVRAIVIEALGKWRAKRALPALNEALAKKSNHNDAYMKKLLDEAIAKLRP